LAGSAFYKRNSNFVKCRIICHGKVLFGICVVHAI
jgi:hypothetical protein